MTGKVGMQSLSEQSETQFSFEDVHIVTVIDRGFVELAGVMLRSLVANGEIGVSNIVVVCDKLTSNDKKNLRSCALPSHVNFIDLTGTALSKIKRLPTNSNWSRTIYARLFLPDLIGVKTGKILYLDADILILRSLKELLTLDMAAFSVAAVGGVSHDMVSRLDLAPETKTLNSGVLLFDVENWNRHHLSAKTLTVASEKSSLLKFFDQDALNIALAGDFLPLDGMWNHPGRGDLADVAILHFTHDKPNSVRCRHPAKNLYLQYRNTTPWKNKPLQSVWHKRFNRIKYSIKRNLRFIYPA
ncbi:glycosyltransferase family 8 protein [Agrobacterium rubi]|uniref:Glycosyl transferase n=1 Tax=Agrobacterium rubi TaxID=28099 RepID=A0AAE7R3D2_9HYPH|nr:glycosyltransferase [Agrobacterium rubi]NTE86921.1 hypothetical protein [Agrobacterium rubi]NTF02855.1 hypothetical protein [Agrobacterium rubi]NTF37099.1 hypothetical protein [Agrobacterium rubi]QTF99532.1 hypothetical protein G6M88_03545 [Agrobacterium rubi]